jgi:hypothetical protein
MALIPKVVEQPGQRPRYAVYFRQKVFCDQQACDKDEIPVTTHTRSGALSSSSSFCWSMVWDVFWRAGKGGRVGAEGRDLNWVVAEHAGRSWAVGHCDHCESLLGVVGVVDRDWWAGDTSKNPPFQHDFGTVCMTRKYINWLSEH